VVEHGARSIDGGFAIGDGEIRHLMKTAGHTTGKKYGPIQDPLTVPTRNDRKQSEPPQARK
jgi:hypothetical protein